jgi:hypothetical protein
MRVTINGPDLSETNAITDENVHMWYSTKRRRKLHRDQKMQKRIRGLHQGPAAHKFLQMTEKKDNKKLKLNRVLQALKLPTISSDDVASYESDLDECYY